MHADTLLLHRGAKTSVYTPYVRILRSRFATKRRPSHMKPPRDSSANVNACASGDKIGPLSAVAHLSVGGPAVEGVQWPGPHVAARCSHIAAGVHLYSGRLASAPLTSAQLASAQPSSNQISSAPLASPQLSSAQRTPAQPSSTRLGWARLDSARLGFAWLRSASLGSARLGLARLFSCQLRSAWLSAATASAAAATLVSTDVAAPGELLRAASFVALRAAAAAASKQV